jgi:hypothetical protein
MNSRRRLPNRTASMTFDFESQGLKFTATVSRFADGEIAELFLTNHKAGQRGGHQCSGRTVFSIAIQYGVPIDVIRKR